ncbi:MAG: hypothetical protein H7A37_07945 [Chlamydiales bacterium]|nr:hypothetical protein [Chlamydiales bacterium]
MKKTCLSIFITALFLAGSAAADELEDTFFLAKPTEPIFQFEGSGMYYFITPDLALGTQPVEYPEDPFDHSWRFGLQFSLNIPL